VKELFEFVLAIAEPLEALIEHIASGEDDPEKEKQLAMEIVRKAKDRQAKQEISGP